ncbi:unnamed protein product [Leptidea sinapis]|uniref:RRM domain-containing protein n=1 Tax=Leptidea sinapis TaxID=189913 RepID=A0A5E4PPP6_9NEOP|nr:unnamed protein product [Leptidea sinapis]
MADVLDIENSEEFEVDEDGEQGIARLKEKARKHMIVLLQKVMEILQAHKDQLRVGSCLSNQFSEFGEIKNIHLNLDRRTGFLKGYALSAREALDGADILGQAISVDWCFVKGPTKVHKRRR